MVFLCHSHGYEIKPIHDFVTIIHIILLHHYCFMSALLENIPSFIDLFAPSRNLKIAVAANWFLSLDCEHSFENVTFAESPAHSLFLRLYWAPCPLALPAALSSVCSHPVSSVFLPALKHLAACGTPGLAHGSPQRSYLFPDGGEDEGWIVLFSMGCAHDFVL